MFRDDVEPLRILRAAIDASGATLCELNSGQQLLLQSLEIRFRKRGIHDHVSVNVERAVQCGRERGQAYSGRIQVRGRVQIRSQRRQFVADLQRSPPGGAFIQHLEGQFPRAGNGELVRGISGIHQQIQSHQRDGMPLGQKELQTIRQFGPLKRRELDFRIRARPLSTAAWVTSRPIVVNPAAADTWAKVGGYCDLGKWIGSPILRARRLRLGSHARSRSRDVDLARRGRARRAGSRGARLP